jgi:phosphoribosylanthranilate isomerase
MVRIKICGITNYEDASAAVAYGADALGFIFYPQSPRYITAETARFIIASLPPFISTVGVFVNASADTINEIKMASGIDLIQLHGEEPPVFCAQWPRIIKALRICTEADLENLAQYQVASFLLDTYSTAAYGGTGQVFNWDIALAAKHYGRIILAGGLTPDNVAQAISFVQPYGIDVSSGVEKTPGKKDHIRLRQFIERAKAAATP